MPWLDTAVVARKQKASLRGRSPQRVRRTTALQRVRRVVSRPSHHDQEQLAIVKQMAAHAPLSTNFAYS